MSAPAPPAPPPAIGHNTKPAKDPAAEALRSVVERIERLDEERRAIVSDINDIYREAKGKGFDVKTLRRFIKERRQDPAVLEEQETIIDMYRRLMGM